jgi:hypothetical protein
LYREESDSEESDRCKVDFTNVARCFNCALLVCGECTLITGCCFKNYCGECAREKLFPCASGDDCKASSQICAPCSAKDQKCDCCFSDQCWNCRALFKNCSECDRLACKCCQIKGKKGRTFCSKECLSWGGKG